MKKFLTLLFTLAFLLVGVFVLWATGAWDTRFWFYDKEEWKPFYDGVYRSGIDIEPGSYDVQIKGGSKNIGYYEINDIDGKDVAGEFMAQGSMGLHFVIRENETLNIRTDSATVMKYKKID